MPYVFVDELDEGMEEADVRSAEEYDALGASLDSVTKERDELTAKYEEMVARADSVSKELDDAKRKFASAFLNAPFRDDNRHEEPEEPYKASTFDTLFG